MRRCGLLACPSQPFTVLDATGKSLFDLGKYDQCRDLGRDVAQYCYVQYPLIVDSAYPRVSQCPVHRPQASPCLARSVSALRPPALMTISSLPYEHASRSALTPRQLFEIETDIFGNKSQEYIHDSFVHCLRT